MKGCIVHIWQLYVADVPLFSNRRALGVFVLWVFLIHLACYIVHKLSRKSSNVLQLGLNCLLLSTNNTGCIGWPVLIATVGQQSAVLSMLLGEDSVQPTEQQEQHTTTTT
jgi:DMSO/TMAO reductase YedYZ heme-binding membrane subunit